MASKRLCSPLTTVLSPYSVKARWRALVPTSSMSETKRSMASETPSSTETQLGESLEYRTIPPSVPYTLPANLAIPAAPTHLQNPKVITTLYKFPSLEPLAFLEYPSVHLHLPLRRDLLHRAIVYEGDKHRGLSKANTKWRSEVRGSGRKIRPQKGSGRARLGDKKSPMLRGGGVAFGPKPRDYTSALPRKLYDIAWRTAFSYRYRRGELVVIDKADLSQLKEWGIANQSNRWSDVAPYYVKHLFDRLGWGNANGRSMVVTHGKNHDLERALELRGEVGRARSVEKVDVKNLLEMGRIVIEKAALDHLLLTHQQDICRRGVLRVGDTPAYRARKQMLQDIAEEDAALQQAMHDEAVNDERLEGLVDDIEETDIEASQDGVGVDKTQASIAPDEPVQSVGKSHQSFIA